jgi:MFS family permease
MSDLTINSSKEPYKPSIFRSFKITGYPTYWFAMMAQMAGLNMQMVSRAWLIYELSGSYTILGAMTVAHALPMLVTSMFGGVLADRFLKKRLMQSGQILLAFTSFFVALCLSYDLIVLSTGVGVSYVMMASVFQGTIMGFTMPSRQAVIPEIVGRENLTNAIALNQSGMNLNRLAAPGVAGVMIALLGITTVYYFMTFLYVLATIIISFLPITKSLNPNAKQKTPLTDLIDGFKYIFNNSVIFYLLLATLFSVVLSMPYMGLMPIFAKDIQLVVASDFAWMNLIYPIFLHIQVFDLDV